MSTVQKEEWEYYFRHGRRCHQREPRLNIQLPRRAHQASFDVYSWELAEDLGKGCLRVDNNGTVVSISDVWEPACMWWYAKNPPDNRKILDWLESGRGAEGLAVEGRCIGLLIRLWLQSHVSCATIYAIHPAPPKKSHQAKEMNKWVPLTEQS